MGGSDVPDWSEFGKMLPEEARRQQEKCDIGHISDIFLKNMEKVGEKFGNVKCLAHICMYQTFCVAFWQSATEMTQNDI